MKQILTFVIIAIFTLALVTSAQAVFATKLVMSGDFGGKSASVKNLQNIAKEKACFVGLGDYMYDKHPGSNVNNVRLGDLWDDIVCKVGYPGNHELDRNQEAPWAAETFKYGDLGYNAWKLRDIGIIGINPYEDFDQGSDQYNFVKRKATEFNTRSDINWVVFAVHEPLWTPTTIGGHGPNTDLRDTYTPIINSVDKKGVLLVQAHNHIVAAGVVNDINMLVCGGGGYGGDELGKLNGYEWGTDKMSYCVADFNANSVNAKVVDTNGAIIRNQVFTR
jgi:hypothetical protein